MTDLCGHDEDLSKALSIVEEDGLSLMYLMVLTILITSSLLISRRILFIGSHIGPALFVSLLWIVK